MHRPPPNPENGFLFDSIVAERIDALPPVLPPAERNPKLREIIVYETNRVYPEYVVTFTRCIETPAAISPVNQEYWKSLVV